MRRWAPWSRGCTHILHTYTGSRLSQGNFYGMMSLPMHVAGKALRKEVLLNSMEFARTLFWKGWAYVSFKRSRLLNVQIFLLCLSLDNCISELEVLFLCTYVEYWNGSRTPHGASNTKGIPVLILDKRKGRLAHVFWVSSMLLSLCYWIFVVSPLKLTMFSLTRKPVQPQYGA